MTLTGVLAALLAGLVGSGHCVAMCGGIAGGLALAGDGGTGQRLGRALLHNAGRVTSYALAGALVGGVGGGLGAVVAPDTAGIALRAASGAVIALIGVQLLTGRALLRPVERLGFTVWRRVAPLARRLRPGDGAGSGFLLGMLWGWLPCGLVYSLLLTAAVTGSAASGAAVMVAFGVGTAPALLGLATVAGGPAARLHRPAWRRTFGALIMVLGLWTAAGPGLVPLVTGHGAHAATSPDSKTHGG